MPPDAEPEATPGPSHVDNATLIAAFLAEGGTDGKDAAPAETPPEAGKGEPEPKDEPEADDEKPADPKEGEPEAEEDADEPAFDVVALTAAIEAKDPKALIEALGDVAEELLGSKAHASLRRQATELKKAQDKNKKFEEHLEAKYGDPVKARKAAADGDINAFLEITERQWGNSWTALVKAVNEAMAGKPARIENVAESSKRAELERVAQREAAQKTVKADITRVVTGTEKALMKACPRIVDLVYEKMRTGWNEGVNTPAKALKLVKKELQAESAALVKFFAPKPPKKKTEITPPKPPAERGAPPRQQTDAEMREEFLRAEGLWRGA